MSPAAEGLPFAKFHGAGNDYVLVDGRGRPELLDRVEGLARAVSDRRHGVGSDGLIVLAESASAAARMLMWNADGSRGSVCGNGLRCLVGFAQACGLGVLSTVESDARIHLVEATERDARGAIRAARLTMGGVVRTGQTAVAGHSVSLGSVGNPHAVAFVDSLRTLETFDLPNFAESVTATVGIEGGVNVEIACVDAMAEGVTIHQRTFERGSGETLACGSGATFVASVAIDEGLVRGPRVAVRLRGGVLTVHRREDGEHALEGPVTHVFDGRWPAAGSS